MSLIKAIWLIRKGGGGLSMQHPGPLVIPHFWLLTSRRTDCWFEPDVDTFMSVQRICFWSLLCCLCVGIGWRNAGFSPLISLPLLLLLHAFDFINKYKLDWGEGWSFHFAAHAVCSSFQRQKNRKSSAFSHMTQTMLHQELLSYFVFVLFHYGASISYYPSVCRHSLKVLLDLLYWFF